MKLLGYVGSVNAEPIELDIWTLEFNEVIKHSPSLLRRSPPPI